jgi:hypothetical protein
MERQLYRHSCTQSRQLLDATLVVDWRDYSFGDTMAKIYVCSACEVPVTWGFEWWTQVLMYNDTVNEVMLCDDCREDDFYGTS